MAKKLYECPEVLWNATELLGKPESSMEYLGGCGILRSSTEYSEAVWNRYQEALWYAKKLYAIPRSCIEYQEHLLLAEHQDALYQEALWNAKRFCGMLGSSMEYLEARWNTKNHGYVSRPCIIAMYHG